MNFSKAKQIPIVDYLAGRGVQPKSVQGNQCWYCSPLRQENTPSFKVDTKKNLWFDHATGRGGTIIELVELLDNVTPNEALQALSNQDRQPLPDSFSFHQQQSGQVDQVQGVRINSIKLLNNPSLVRYLESRKIPFQLGRAYLSECYYSIRGKNFFALGFQNDLGGYELRNSLWQGASSPKGISTHCIADSSTVAVFEGFFDMLSAMVYFEKLKPVHSVLVLNSVSLLDTALPALSQYERVNLFLDNDQAGRKAVEVIRAACRSVVDYSARYYPQHKDFNDFLTHKVP